MVEHRERLMRFGHEYVESIGAIAALAQSPPTGTDADGALVELGGIQLQDTTGTVASIAQKMGV